MKEAGEEAKLPYPVLSLMEPPQEPSSEQLRAAFGALSDSFRFHSGRFVMIPGADWSEPVVWPEGSGGGGVGGGGGSEGKADDGSGGDIPLAPPQTPTKADLVARAKAVRTEHAASWDRDCAVALGRLLRAGAEFELKVSRGGCC